MFELSMTPTLLNSFDWLLQAPSSWRGKAQEDLINTIRRMPYEMSPQAQRGIDFETDIYNGINRWADLPLVDEVITAVKGGVYQTWTSHRIKVDNTSVRCYGKMDCRLPDKIIDIKTTANYKGFEQYLHGWQPVIYRLGENIKNFEFHIVEWDTDGQTPHRYFVLEAIPYTMDILQFQLGQQIRTFYRWLCVNSMWEDYVYIFSKQDRQLHRCGNCLMRTQPEAMGVNKCVFEEQGLNDDSAPCLWFAQIERGC